MNQSYFSPTMLLILDGFGYQPGREGNAVAQAKMPTMQMLLNNYPSTLLQASGEAVGLLPGYMGNSEVGHLTLGAGRIVESDLKRINESIENGEMEKNHILQSAFEKLKKSGGALHLMGLLSDGGVHSHEFHLHTFLRMAARAGLNKIFVHAFTDGRDVGASSAAIYLQRLDSIFNEIGCGQLASIHGRFYAMDRDKNLERTKISYDVLTLKQGELFDSWKDALDSAYVKNETDEFIHPVQLKSWHSISNGDGIIFFNFRPDRARQLTQAFLDPNEKNITLPFFITPTCYQSVFPEWGNQFLFKRNLVEHTLLEEITAQLNCQNEDNSIFVIAETEKYAHVTYFFKGMREPELPNETRILIPSIKTKNYINYPEMSAAKITEKLLESLQTKPARFYLVNYANLDMVGHSGDFNATVKACEFVDSQLKLLYEQVVLKMGGTIFVTGDHGNAEAKIDLQTHSALTTHTMNPVPFIKVCSACKISQKSEWPKTPVLGLANVAPTILKSMNLEIPQQMTNKVIF